MNITTNTTSEFADTWAGGWGRFTVSGTWGGATAKLAIHDGTNWIPAGDDGSFTDDGGCEFRANLGDRIGVITTGGTASDIDAFATPIDPTFR